MGDGGGGGRGANGMLTVGLHIEKPRPGASDLLGDKSEPRHLTLDYPDII